MQCPHCGNKMVDDGEFAGQDVACSRCGGQFRASKVKGNFLAGTVRSAGEGPPACPPLNIQVNVPRNPDRAEKNPRLDPLDWFSRAFGVSSGLMLGIIATVVAVVVIPAAILLVIYSANRIAVTATKSVKESIASAGDRRFREQVIEATRTVLKQHGIVQISNDTHAERESGTVWDVEGHGRKSDRNVCPFHCKFDVTEFDGKIHCKLIALELDETANADNLRDKVLEETLKTLKQHGVVRISKDTVVDPASNTVWNVEGHCQKADHSVCPFSCEFQVTEFDDELHINATLIKVDGVVVHPEEE